MKTAAKTTLFLFLFLLVFVLLPTAFSPRAGAWTGDLDEIEEYYITVTPNEDATLDMEYHLRWKVLDSTSEGPLEWVKIGVANRFVEDIRAQSDAIDDISYSSEDGAFIRCDLNRAYYAGETLDIDFSFRQERIFSKPEGDYIEFGFMPGYFPETEILDFRLTWKKAAGFDLLYTNAGDETAEAYVWNDAIPRGGRIRCDMRYARTSFPNADFERQYSDQTQNPLTFIVVLIVIFGGIAGLRFLFRYLRRRNGDGYGEYRGYGGRIHYYGFPFWHRSGVDRNGKSLAPDPVNVGGGFHGGGGGGGSCACACACACAGGGRAGCSRKDFVQSGDPSFFENFPKKSH